MRRPVVFAVTVLLVARMTSGQDPRIQLHQDFSEDPHWEAIHNRIVAENPPTKTQDFGWDGHGRIGGTMWVSRTPAWYGMPLGRPLSFKDSFSASGKIAIRSMGGSAYFGFFNSTRQE